MPLFDYAIIFKPLRTKAEMEAGQREREELLVPPKTIVAKDQAEAAMIAARAVPASHEDRLDRIEIAVRPF